MLSIFFYLFPLLALEVVSQCSSGQGMTNGNCASCVPGKYSSNSMCLNVPQGYYNPNSASTGYLSCAEAYSQGAVSCKDRNKYQLTSYAGSGSTGSSNGAGASATFYNPVVPVFDSVTGDVFVTEWTNRMVRKISSSLVVSTHAGTGSAGTTDGSAAAATFGNLLGLAISPSRDLYVSDWSNNRVRKISSSGLVTTFAGSSSGSAEGTGTNAQFNQPEYILVYNSNVFVSESGNHRIRKITSPGTVSTYAGSSQGFQDGSTCKFNGPMQMVADSTGSIFVSDNVNNRIRKVLSNGGCSTFAGSGVAGYGNGFGTAAVFKGPRGLAINSADGTLYVAEWDGCRIRRISAAREVSSLVGTGASSSADGWGGAASINHPHGLFLDSSGNLYSAEDFGHKVKKLFVVPISCTAGSYVSNEVCTVVPSGNYNPYENSGVYYVCSNAATSGMSFCPKCTLGYGLQNGVCVICPAGRFANNDTCTDVPAGYFSPSAGQTSYFSCPQATQSQAAKCNDADKYQLTSFAGSGATGSTNGAGTSASFYNPINPVVDSIAGDVFITEWMNRMVRKVSSSFTVTTYAGTGAAGYADGVATAATFGSLVGLAISSSRDLYVADWSNNKVRKISSSGVVTTFAGTTTQGLQEGTGTNARLSAPEYILVYNDNIFVSESGNHRIRKISTNGLVTTHAGTTQGFQDGSSCKLNGPRQLVVDSSGSMYVSDASNNRIRRVFTDGACQTFAGSTAGNTNGIGTNAAFNDPRGLAIDLADGTLYVAEWAGSRIRRVSAAGEVSNIVGSGSSSSADGWGTSASINHPAGLFVDSSGNILIGEDFGHKIKQILVTTVTCPAGSFVSNGVCSLVAQSYFNPTPNSGLYYYCSNAGMSGMSFCPPCPFDSQWTGSVCSPCLSSEFSYGVTCISKPTSQPTAQPTGQPSRQPTSQPTRQPTSQPTSQPTRQPTSQPTRQPTSQPTSQPTRQPTSQPTSQPSRQPTTQPTSQPTAQPTRNPTTPSSQPTTQPSSQPSSQPTSQPSGQPTAQPTSSPSCQPTAQPTTQPSSQPSDQPTSRPTSAPTAPSALPTAQPSNRPTSQPSAGPTFQPFATPTCQPTSQPSCQPSAQPSVQPSSVPSAQPTGQPTTIPTTFPTVKPTSVPSIQPTSQPTSQPSSTPTNPTAQPTSSPTSQPSAQPTVAPLSLPTKQPTSQPSTSPTGQPTSKPTRQPSVIPSGQPTSGPTRIPSSQPSAIPTRVPTSQPSCQPTSQPSSNPSSVPTVQPTNCPSSSPSSIPSYQPTSKPSGQPSVQPSSQPTGSPSSIPSNTPSVHPSSQPSAQPTTSPSRVPSSQPSSQPSSIPSVSPSTQPSSQPSSGPSNKPSVQPTSQPTVQPTTSPSGSPSSQPSSQPSSIPSVSPTAQPSSQPTSAPSNEPTVQPTSQPSAHPTTSPSRVPTSRPSSQPSSIPSIGPTGQPTSQPTSGPSNQPSAQPTSQPTTSPSSVPSTQPSSDPTSNPTSQPTFQPTSAPSSQPSGQPTLRPISQPSNAPTSQPTVSPTTQPSNKPTGLPTGKPSARPSTQPSTTPSSQPSSLPSALPSSVPSKQPNSAPTSQPTSVPSFGPTGQPSNKPTSSPSGSPTVEPTSQPTNNPSSQPTGRPSSRPSAAPSSQPTNMPSSQPSNVPTTFPTGQPSGLPSSQPSSRPSGIPSATPTEIPSGQPTTHPTANPSSQPTTAPSTRPTTQPSSHPTAIPSGQPSCSPSLKPTSNPTNQPTVTPSALPTMVPSCQPTAIPSSQPSDCPTAGPTLVPSSAPSSHPSSFPTGQPTCNPSVIPSSQPSSHPSSQPTVAPSSLPTLRPSSIPSSQPSRVPSAVPSSAPSSYPSKKPSSQPSASPTIQPSSQPSVMPSSQPSSEPTAEPSAIPSSQPSLSPSNIPSAAPTDRPSSVPTASPTYIPSAQPSGNPVAVPTLQPTGQPSRNPTGQPTGQPTRGPSGFPSGHPSWQPIGHPSCTPTGQPTRQPTGRPSGNPTSQPSARPTESPTNEPIGQPTGPPTNKPSTQPTGPPSGGPLGQLPSRSSTGCPVSLPSSVPTSMPSFAPPKIVEISSITVDKVAANWIGLNISVASVVSGVKILCNCYDSGKFPNSSADLISSGFGGFMIGSSITLKIVKLIPVTSYMVFCTSVTSAGGYLPKELMLSKFVVANTLCCKKITIQISVLPLVSHSIAKKFLSIMVDFEPSELLSVSINMEFTPKFDSSSDLPRLNPNTTAFLGRKDVRFMTLFVGSAGTARITAFLAGARKNDYEVDIVGPTTINILGLSEQPPVPQLSNAIFDPYGTKIYLSFSSATNKGGFVGNFDCQLLFAFAGSQSASCSWSSPNEVIIVPGGFQNDRLIVGSLIILANNSKVQAACPPQVSKEECAAFNETLPGSSVAVQSPELAALPVVRINAVNTIYGCNDFTMDLSATFGNGGRDWKILDFSIDSPDSTANVTNLKSIFGAISSIDVPIVVNNKEFKSAVTYSITVKVCNFLGACGFGSHSVSLSTLQDLIPVVSITGQTQRTIYRKDNAQFQSVAYTPLCGGGGSFIDLRFAWSVQSSGIDLVVSSDSLDPSRFSIPAFTLSVLKAYEIRVAVAHLRSGRQTSASCFVNVLQSAMVAFISGGSFRSVRQGNAQTLDASRSYDPDELTKAGIVFDWSFAQITPTFIEEGPFSLHNMSSDYSIVTANSNGAELNSTTEVRVSVEKGSRFASTAVSLVVVEGDSPVVSILSSAVLLSSSFDTRKRLTLSASISTKANCFAKWSVDDATVILPSISTTPVSTTIPFGTSKTLNLVVSPNTLPVTSTLVFQIQCGPSIATVSVTTNGPPTSGALASIPKSGTELLTRFQLVATKWIDPDLPLSYLFGFYSDVDGSFNQIIRNKAETSFYITTLPAGTHARNNSLNCFVNVFDALGSYTTAEAAATVNRTVAKLSVAAVQDKVSESSGNVDSVKAALAMVAAIINQADCAHAPDCLGLKRRPCYLTANTCGKCLLGHFGDAGDGNTACVNVSSVLSIGDMSLPTASVSSVDCFNHSSCNPWERCSGGVCVVREKVCLNNCTGHGICRFIKISSGLNLRGCSFLDTTCQAKCNCNDGFSGPSCSISVEELELLQTQRSLLFTGLLEVVRMDAATTENVEGWVSSLSSLTSNPFELSSDSVNNSLGILSDVLERSSEVSISFPDFTSFLNVIDNCADTVKEITTSNASALHVGSRTMGLLDRFGALVADELMSGEPSYATIANSFRVRATSESQSGENLTIRLPTTELEQVSGREPFVNVPGDALRESDSLAMYFIGINSVVYQGVSGDGMYLANPMRIGLAGSDLTRADFVMFSVPISPVPNVHYGENYSTICRLGRVSKENFICKSTGLVINHTCSGLSDYVLRTSCPNLISRALCTMMSSDLSCSVVNQTDSSIICKCPLHDHSEEGWRRLLSGERMTRKASDLGVTARYFSSEFVGTLYTFTSFSSMVSLERVRIVLILYGFVWGSGAVLLLAFKLKQRKKSMKVADDGHSSSATPRDRLKSYIAEIAPPVFRQGPKMSRMVHELIYHHRYFSIFGRLDAHSQSRSLRLFHLLTIQSMLMFLLAVCFELQGPDDDGTCDPLTNKSDCLEPLSYLDNRQHYCNWNESEQLCRYRPPTFSWAVITYIYVMVSICTAILNLPIDLLFEILHAPVADPKKSRNAPEGTMVRMQRRVSNAIRRASAAVSDAIVEVVQSFKLKRMTKRAGKTKQTGFATREMPDSALIAYEASQQSIAELHKLSGHMLTKFSASNLEMAKTTGKLQFDFVAKDLNVSEVFESLYEQLRQARTQLADKELARFDAEWGLDNNGNFVAMSREHLFGQKEIIPGKTLVEGAIEDCHRLVLKKARELEYAYDRDIGLEVIHLFVTDLLGRNNPAAKIFSFKSKEDYRNTMVLPRSLKMFAVGAVVLLNIFFTMFVILRAHQRQKSWQYGYLTGCIVQLVVEVFLNESIECFWINFGAPSLAMKEIDAAMRVLMAAVENVCQPRPDDVEGINAPEYFFVSTNLAKQYPDLQESLIVLSYHSHFPGEISRQWKTPKQEISGSYFQSAWAFFAFRTSKLLASLFVALQLLASSPIVLQRSLIRVSQPWLLSGLTFAVYRVVSNPYALAAVIFFVVCLCSFLLYQWQKVRLGTLPTCDPEQTNANTCHDNTEEVLSESRSRQEDKVNPERITDAPDQDQSLSEGSRCATPTFAELCHMYSNDVKLQGAFVLSLYDNESPSDSGCEIEAKQTTSEKEEDDTPYYASDDDLPMIVPIPPSGLRKMHLQNEDVRN